MRELMHELASKLTREVMCEHQLKQTDMLDIFGSQGDVSQVLNAKSANPKPAACQNGSACRSIYSFD